MGPADLPPGDQQLLAGAWKVRLSLEGDTLVEGTVRLAAMPAPLPFDTGGPSLPFVEGVFQLPRAGEFPQAIGDSTATGYLAENRELVLMLNVSGRCGDCGNIRIEGRLNGDTIRGRWTHEFLTETQRRPVLLWR